MEEDTFPVISFLCAVKLAFGIGKSALGLTTAGLNAARDVDPIICVKYDTNLQ